MKHEYAESLINVIKKHGFEADASEEMVATVSFHSNVICKICSGFGHGSIKCPIVKRLKRLLRRLGMIEEWNKLKLGLSKTTSLLKGVK